MIGFFQNSMAKHHRLVFGVLLVFIGVTFVFYTGSGSVADLFGLRRASSVLGVSLGNADEIAPYRAGVLLTNGARRLTTQSVVQRIFMVKQAEAYQIPEPTQAQLSEYLAEQGLTAENIALIKRNFDVSEDVLRTAIVHSWKIQQFLQTFGNVPSVFEFDVELAWKEMSTRWKAEFAELSPASAALPNVAPEDAQLAEFFEKNKEDFRVEEQVEFLFAKFVPDAGAAETVPEPTDFELSSFVAEKTGDPEKAAEELKNNRAALVAEWKKSQALDAAAAAVSNTLYEKLPTDSVNPRQENFSEAVAQSGLQFTKIPAFPRSAVPEGAGVPAEILRSAVGSLNDTLWRTDAIPAGDSVYVVVFTGTVPSRIPAFDEVKDAVASAWRIENEESRFLAFAREKGEALGKAVADGSSFSEAARALGFNVVSPDEFTAQSVPAEFRAVDVVGILKTVPENEISPLFRVGENAVFAKTVSRSVPALDKSGAEFSRIRQFFDRRTSWDIFRMQIAEELAEVSAKYGLRFDEEE